MNLKSCDMCGVVLDLSKISEPQIVRDDGTIDTAIAVWDGEDYIPIIMCPVCNATIKYER